MFRYVKTGSAVFQFLSWLFVASLFCDGANLDDLFHGVSVLHDDFEIGAGCAGGIDGSCSAAIGGNHGSTGTTVGTLPAPAPASEVRIVIDQDSPSLEAGGLRIVFEPLASILDTPAKWRESRLPSETLHIRFRHLLI